jgi:hypothetical protein
MNLLPLALLMAATVPPQPSPDLSPDDVVRIVATALRHYNSPTPNAGIYMAYQFASPANRAATGPYGHFLGAVKNRDFAALLHENPEEFGPIVVTNNYAEQKVTVHESGGHDVIFTFSLGRQRDGVYRGCWMVDGVGSSLQH